MDGIRIPDEQVVSMDEIAPGVIGLRIAFVNLYGIRNANGAWTLVDTGIPGSAALVTRWADKHFGQAPSAIVLTHGHFDHAGSATNLADHWNVPVYAHALERPYLAGEKSYPAPDLKVGGGMMTYLSPLYPTSPYDLGGRLRLLSEAVASGSEDLPDLRGWRALHTPGHTPGHISLFREEDRTLLVGDAFCSTKPESFFEAAILQQPELHGPPAYFTWNWDAARASVQKLSQLAPHTLALGHGKPIAGANVAEELRSLADRFDQVAMPEHHR